MRIQTQNGLYVVPVFLTLAIAISAIVGVQERNKTLWGLREEAGALAIGIAEFIGAEGLTMISEGFPQDATVDEFLRPVRTILEWERAKRVFAMVPGSNTPVFDLGPWAGDSTEMAATLLAADESSTPADFRVVDRPPRGTIMQATVFVTDPDGRVLGRVGVETDASALDRLGRTWIRESVIRLLIALAIGLACSTVLSWVLKSRIRLLGLALEAASGGDYATELDANFGMIRETSDLANTFSTMMSIVRGTISRSRRNLLGIERFRTDEDMARAIDSNCWKPKEMSQDGTTILVRGIGRLSPGTFFDLFDVDHRVYVLFGRVPARGALNATLSGSAILSFLRQLLAQDKMADIASETADLFEVQELTILEWVTTDQRLVVHRFDPGARKTDETATVQTGSFREVFHDLGDEADTRIRLFLKAFSSPSPAKLMEELMMLVSVIQPMPTGVLAVVYRE